MKSNRFIPGIFNYCDYWCERCAFTRRCRNFAMGREMEREVRGEKVGDDATHQAFWNQLADKLREATVFGRAGDWTDEVDFDDTPDPAYEKRRDEHEKAVEEHPAVKMAFAYMTKVSEWLKTADADLKSVADELLTAAGSPFAGDDEEEEARQIGEWIEVVAWYHTLIPPKVARAIGTLVDEDGAEGAGADEPAEMRMEDANGSGKVALVAIERSAAAWVSLRKILPRREDEILEMLALLSRLQRGLHAALPGAKSFIRPGFDGEPDNL